MKLVILGKELSYHVLRFATEINQPGDVMHIISSLDKDVIKESIRQLRPDIIHAFFARDYGIAAYNTGFHPMTITAMGTDIYKIGGKGERIKELTTLALQNADTVFTDSFDLCWQLRLLGVQDSKIMYSVPGVKLQLFHDGIDASQLKKELDIPPDAKVILSPRAMYPNYSHETAVKALKTIIEKKHNAYLVMHGGVQDKLYRTCIEQLASVLGVSERVRFYPYLSYGQLPILYNMADVVLSLAETDGTSAAVLEAMACGAPLIASNVASIAEWIIHETNGILVNPHDDVAVADAIIWIVYHVPEIKKAWAKINRHAIMTRANCDVSTLEVRKQLQSLVNRYRFPYEPQYL